MLSSIFIFKLVFFSSDFVRGNSRGMLMKETVRRLPCALRESRQDACPPPARGEGQQERMPVACLHVAFCVKKERKNAESGVRQRRGSWRP